MKRKRALELCERLWYWLHSHPSRGKRDWPGWSANGGPTPWCFCSCPCCEYALRGGGSCRRCPLKSLWGTDCTGDESPYFKWNRSRSPKTRKKYAAQIRDAARAELAKYKGGR